MSKEHTEHISALRDDGQIRNSASVPFQRHREFTVQRIPNAYLHISTTTQDNLSTGKDHDSSNIRHMPLQLRLKNSPKFLFPDSNSGTTYPMSSRFRFIYIQPSIISSDSQQFTARRIRKSIDLQKIEKRMSPHSEPYPPLQMHGRRTDRRPNGHRGQRPSTFQGQRK